MATKYSQTQNNNNRIEINNVITNDTTEDTVIETTFNQHQKNHWQSFLWNYWYNCKRTPRIIRANRLLGFERVCLYCCIYNQTTRWRAENHSSNAEQKETNAKVNQKFWEFHWKHKKVYRQTYNRYSVQKIKHLF